MFFDKNLNQIDYTSISWGDDNYGLFDDNAKHSQLVYYLKKFNISKKICIVNHAQFDETCINASNIEFLLINCSDHPYVLPIYKINKPSLIIDSDFNKSNYWPFHLLFSAYLTANETVDMVSLRPYWASCINRSPRIPRIYNRVKLDNYNFDKFKFVWFKAEESNGPVPEQQDIIDSIGIDYFKKYQSININAPCYQPKSEYELCAGTVDYTDSYLNLITESRLDDIGFLTEKTYKPIRAGQLFLVQGPVGTIQFLRSIGFDTFDDYINHEYDQIVDWVERTDHVHKELQRIFLDIEKIYFATTERRIKNLQVLKEFVKYDSWTERIARIINANT